MRPAAAALCLLGLLGASGCGRGDRFLTRNAPVILISVDTLRADHLPIYGYRGGATPNLDALRRDAVQFENAYTHVPLTLPSHVSLLTGLLPPLSGVRDNYGYTLSPDVETLEGLLQKAHYATGAAVSSAVLSHETGLNRGFEFYDDSVETGPLEERDGALSARALSGWLEGHRGQPFFAFLHLNEPHSPYDPPEPYRSRFKSAPYDGEIARADEIVGSFLDKLRQWGLYERALVIFVSDHGEGLSDHGEREHGVFLYRESIHVPLLVKFPGRLRAGESVSAPVALTDVFPTVTRVLGLPLPAGRSGVPLTAFLEKPAVPGRRIYSETLYPRLRLGWSDLASLEDERYQYIEAPRSELYDLVSDPGEKKDLSGSLPPAFRAMRVELQAMPRPFEMPGASDPERAKKLASLGYLSATSPSAGGKDLPDPKDRIGDLDGSLVFGKLLAEGKDAELVAATRAFLKRIPGVIDIWRMQANALERLGKRAEAIAALKEGLRASESNALPAMRVPARELLAQLLVKAGRADEALALGGEETFTDPEALNAIGVAQGRAGRTEDAQKTFARALTVDPENASAHFNLGTALLDAGDLSNARDHFERAVRSNPKLAAAWTSLGLTRARLGDDAGAAESWKRALDLDATQYGALYNLAIAEGRRGEVGAARQKLERFVAGAPPALYGRDLAEARRLLKSLGRP